MKTAFYIRKNGDLYITEGVELGYTNLRNITVKGQVIISGGGESNIGGSSITFTDSTIREMIIDAPEDKPVSVKIHPQCHNYNYLADW